MHLGTYVLTVAIESTLQVTWIEHTEYDESSVPRLYRPLLQSGLALGAGRWFATLQRQCECLDILMPYVAAPKQDSPGTEI